jgi:hypothetical protein
MKRLLLEVSSLITDRESEVVTYQLGGQGWRFTGQIVKSRTDAPYTQWVGEVPDSWDVSLLTPDARLRLIVETIEAYA